MNLQISDDYRLKSDKYNVMLEKRVEITKTKKNGELKKNHEELGNERWDVIGFYPTIEKALESLPKHHMRQSEADGIDSIIFEIKSLHDTIRKFCDHMKKVVK